MTTPNGEIPEGGRSADEIAGLVHVTPPAMANPDMLDLAEIARGGFFGNILSGFLSIGAAIGQALSDLADALFGNYTGEVGPLIEIRDGQAALNDRVDLVTDISGYCATYQTRNYRVQGSQTAKIPFNARLGPQKNAHNEDGGIILDAPGTWRIDVFFTLNGGNVFGNSAQRMEIRVYAPGEGGSDEPYSRSWYRFTFDQFAQSYSWPHTVVVEDPGYRVEVWWNKSGTGWWSLVGGTHSSRLSVNRWDIDTEDWIEDTNPPDEDIPEP